jgi:hypothetical protein
MGLNKLRNSIWTVYIYKTGSSAGGALKCVARKINP